MSGSASTPPSRLTRISSTASGAPGEPPSCSLIDLAPLREVRAAERVRQQLPKRPRPVRRVDQQACAARLEQQLTAAAAGHQRRAVRGYHADRHEPGRIAEFERLDAADRAFAALLRSTRRRLAQLYASGIPRARMLRRKEATFAELARQIGALEQHLHVRAPVYKRWIRQGLNNADLVSVGTYYDCLPGFERLLRREGGDLPRFYAAARRLAREPKARRDRQLCSVSDAGESHAAATPRPDSRDAAREMAPSPARIRERPSEAARSSRRRSASSHSNR